MPQLDNGAVIGSEDCLTLNVWKPTTRTTPRPVMVFVHGGGNVQGAVRGHRRSEPQGNHGMVGGESGRRPYLQLNTPITTGVGVRTEQCNFSESISR